VCGRLFVFCVCLPADISSCRHLPQKEWAHTIYIGGVGAIWGVSTKAWPTHRNWSHFLKRTTNCYGSLGLLFLNPNP